MSNNLHLWSTYYVTDSILYACHAFSPLIFTMTLSNKQCCYPHVLDEETKAWRDHKVHRASVWQI